MPGTAHAGDDAILAARDAFRNSDLSGFERAAAGLPAEHVMAPYIDLWRFRLKQPDSRTPEGIEKEAELEYLLNLHANTWPAEQFRRDYLLALAKRGDWSKFAKQQALLVQKDDMGSQCLATLAESVNGKDVGLAVQSFMTYPKEFPEGCILMGEKLHEAGKIGHKEIMQRIFVLVENGNNSNATRVYSYLHNRGGKERGTDPKLLDNAIEKSAKFLKDLPGKTSEHRLELAAVAISRLSRTEPEEASGWLEKLGPRMEPDVRSWAWSQIGLFSARKWHPDAISWFNNGKPEQRSREAGEWLVRLHLLKKDWSQVLSSIGQLSTESQADTTWRYWQARAKGQLGDTVGARSVYLQLASPFNFYGQLSIDELGQSIVMPPTPSQALSQQELQQAAKSPGFHRALIWYRLNQRTEGFREFNFSLAGLSDRQLLAAATWAAQNELPDRAIAAADRTQVIHDIRLRYLTPYKDSLMDTAISSGLEPAWVYGLIRQESRFIITAKSTVGASGLMQLMPATAKMVARKIGLNGFEQAQVNDIQTNLKLGTSYLRMLMEQLDNSIVLASAGYNAGPGRPRNWRTKLGFPNIDGDIFAEAIPFLETRDYVKKVSANTVAYAHLLDGKPQSLKQRLGIISSQSQRMSTDAELVQNDTTQ
jgi:soluble lytic murein transglycosylase